MVQKIYQRLLRTRQQRWHQAHETSESFGFERELHEHVMALEREWLAEGAAQCDICADWLLVFEGNTDPDDWIDAIVSLGKSIYYARDDLLGLCKFAGAPNAGCYPSSRASRG